MQTFSLNTSMLLTKLGDVAKPDFPFFQWWENEANTPQKRHTLPSQNTVFTSSDQPFLKVNAHHVGNKPEL